MSHVSNFFLNKKGKKRIKRKKGKSKEKKMRRRTLRSVREKRERERKGKRVFSLLSKICGNRTIGFRRSKRQSRSTHRELRVGTCKTQGNSNLLRNGKMVSSIKIQNFSRSRMMKQTSPLESSREI